MKKKINKSKTQPKTRKRKPVNILKSQLSNILKTAEGKDTTVTCWGCNGMSLKELTKLLPYETYKNGRLFKTKAYLCLSCYDKIMSGQVIKED